MVIRLNHFESHFQTVAGLLSPSCRGPFDFTTEYLVIIGCCILGLLWAFINIWQVSKVNVEKGITGYEDPKHPYTGKEVTSHQKSLLIELGHKISTVHSY